MTTELAARTGVAQMSRKGTVGMRIDGLYVELGPDETSEGQAVRVEGSRCLIDQTIASKDFIMPQPPRNSQKPAANACCKGLL